MKRNTEVKEIRFVLSDGRMVEIPASECSVVILGMDLFAEPTAIIGQMRHTFSLLLQIVFSAECYARYFVDQYNYSPEDINIICDSLESVSLILVNGKEDRVDISPPKQNRKKPVYAVFHNESDTIEIACIGHHEDTVP